MVRPVAWLGSGDGSHGPTDRRVGGRSAAATAVAAVGLGVVLLGSRTARQLRRLRDRGLTVEPLQHDVVLAGEGPPRCVVVLGDSAAAGHGLAHADEALARQVGRGLHGRDGRFTAIRSVAVDGATTGGVLATQVEAARDAEVVLLGVGVNDAIRPHHRTSEVAATLGRLLDAVIDAAAPGADVVLIRCPDLSVAPGLPRILRPPLGWRCRRLARVQSAVADRRGVTVLDVDRWRLGPEVFGPDGFHPASVGQRLLADRVVAALLAGP